VASNSPFRISVKILTVVTEVLCGFFFVSLRNFGIGSQVGLRPLPSISFPIHYSLP